MAKWVLEELGGLDILINNAGVGHQGELADTTLETWKKLIDAYLISRETLVSVVWILDIRRELSELDPMLYDWLCSYSIPYIPVCTKADKVSLGERAKRKEALRKSLGQDKDLVLFSAKTGLGKDVLWKRMRVAMSHVEGRMC